MNRQRSDCHGIRRVVVFTSSARYMELKDTTDLFEGTALAWHGTFKVLACQAALHRPPQCSGVWIGPIRYMYTSADTSYLM